MEDNFVKNFFKLGEEYKFSYIENNFCNFNEFGDDEIVGEFFLVVPDHSGNVASFVLIGSSADDYYYKCIYLDK